MSDTLKKRKTLRGVVVSCAMKDTAAVMVTRYVEHARYGKFIRRKKKYLAHDPGNSHAVGAAVTIEACRPISKRKAFRIVGVQG